MSTETSFNIAVPDSELAYLQQKLALTRLPDELENAGTKYGAPLPDIQRLVARWKDGFDWRAQEARLNEELPQFTRDVDIEDFGALNIHYVHKTSAVVDAIPLLFIHGWPGSFIEVRKILPLLVGASSDGPSFHVVALSLPGYGFSEGPRKQGFRMAQYAEVGHKLMLALGYNEYVLQGGDWGYFVTKKIASMYGLKHAKAWHTNMPISEMPSLLWQPFLFLSAFIPPWADYAQMKAGWEVTKKTLHYGSGYREIQSTQPQTLGYSLADSPVGLLAWIYEKLLNWTDGYAWDDDEVLTWISIYWHSRSGPAASLRIYYEALGMDSPDKKESLSPFAGPKGVPLGVSYFPREVVQLPRAWTRTAGELVFESAHTRGGHFAAHEQPEALVGDLRRMFGKGGPAFGVVNGKTGY